MPATTLHSYIRQLLLAGVCSTSVALALAGPQSPVAEAATGRSSATGGALYGKIDESRQRTPRYKSERRLADTVGGATTRTLRGRRSLRRSKQRKGSTDRRAENRQPQQQQPSGEKAPKPSSPGTFPVTGSYTLGGDEARFGARRTGHTHQGQDIMASEGTPIVAPRDGTVTWRAYQAGGAGYYLVVQDTKLQSRSYVFMHLKEGSLLVQKGDSVRQGQKIGEVGSTGRSEGPHLHFEIWEGGWYAKDGKPIDPLPTLNSWK